MIFCIPTEFVRGVGLSFYQPAQSQNLKRAEVRKGTSTAFVHCSRRISNWTKLCGLGTKVHHLLRPLNGFDPHDPRPSVYATVFDINFFSKPLLPPFWVDGVP